METALLVSWLGADSNLTSLLSKLPSGNAIPDSIAISQLVLVLSGAFPIQNKLNRTLKIARVNGRY